MLQQRENCSWEDDELFYCDIVKRHMTHKNLYQTSWLNWFCIDLGPISVNLSSDRKIPYFKILMLSLMLV